MSRDWIIGLIVAAALAVLGYWVAGNTEWRDETTPTPLKGEARTDPFYAAARLVKQLGAEPATPRDFDVVPPPGAVLVLSSEHWNLLPQRRAALRRWVEAGGRLVLPENLVEDDDELGPWIGVRSQHHELPKKKGTEEKKPRADDANGDEQDQSGSRPADSEKNRSAPPAKKKREPLCPKYIEKFSPELAATAPGAAPMLPPLTEYRVCGLFDRQSLRVLDEVKDKVRPLWSLESKFGPVALRVAAERGTVTVLTGHFPLTWRSPIEGDNAKFLVAITQLKPGDTVWFVSDEDADALPVLMWRYGWPVIVLLLAAFVFIMWRGMSRFGPVAAVPPAARRSLAEQIRGSAEFALRHRRGAVLLAAQRRALDEAAARSVRGWPSMDEKQRVAALARSAGVGSASLAHARSLPRSAQAHDFANAIALLETVRRRLGLGAATNE